MVIKRVQRQATSEEWLLWVTDYLLCESTLFFPTQNNLPKKESSKNSFRLNSKKVGEKVSKKINRYAFKATLFFVTGCQTPLTI